MRQLEIVDNSEKKPELTLKTKREIETKVNKLFTVRAGKRKFEADDKDLTAEVRPLIIHYGDHSKPEYPKDSVLEITGFKVHNCAVTKPEYKVDAGIDCLRQMISKANDEERIGLQQIFDAIVVTRQDINVEVFEKIRALKLLPKQLEDVFCKEKVEYHLKIFPQK